MTFSEPNMLFLLWLLPVLAVVMAYGRSRRKRLLQEFVGGRLLQHLAPGVSEGRRAVKSGMLLVCLLLLALALAGLNYGHEWRSVERRGVSLMVALDCSRSMLATDVAPNRLERAKREIVDLLGMLQGDQVGLTAFAGTAFVQCPLTMDYAGFTIFLDVLAPDFLPVGGTDLAAAVRTAVKGFDPKDPADKAVLLITDGEPTSNEARDEALAAAEEAAAQDIRIYAIGVGSTEPTPIPDGQGGYVRDSQGKIAMTRLDEQTLQALAETTGGVYVRSVTGDMDLEAVYVDAIRADLETKALSSGREKIRLDRYRWLLLPAILLLFAEMALSGRRSQRGRTGVLMLALLAFTAGSSTLALAGAPAQALEGVQAYESQDYAAAADKLLQAKVEAPDDPAVAYNLGAALYRQERWKEAAAEFAAAFESENPELQTKALYNLGNALYRQGQLQQALEQYAKALEVSPDDEDARMNYAFVQKKLQEQPPQQKQDEGGESSENEEHDEGKQDKQQQGGQSQDNGQPQSAQQEQDGESQPPQEQPAAENGNQEEEGRQESFADRVSEDQLPEQGPDQPQAPDEPEQAQAEQAQDEARQAQAQAAAQAAEESMLNRLQDKPGAAFMGRAQKRRVEKDW